MRLFLALAVWVGAGAIAAAQSPPMPEVITKIAFGSCANQDKPVPIFDTIAEQKPDLLLLLGDNVYCDLDKSVEVTPAVIQEKYNTLAALPGWQKLKATSAMMATWDDHDYGHNDAGVEWHLKDESARLFHDFFGTPQDDPFRKQAGLYRAATFGPEGKRVQVIMLDMRYFRSPLKFGRPSVIAPYGMIRQPYVPQTEPGATFLGEEQWKWLEKRLREPADVRLIGSSVQCVSEDHPFEKWANIPAERERLYQLIRDTNANGVVILSGDRHLGELSLTTDAVGYPLYDLTASGLNQAAKRWRATEVNRHRVASMPYGDHFGMVRFDWSADPTITLELRDVEGEVVFRHAVPIRLLTPQAGAKRAARPADEPARPDGVISPAEAAKKVGETVTVQFTVQSGRAVGSGMRILLNSDADFRSKDNFTVVVNAAAKTGALANATFDTFKGKVIRVTGPVSLYSNAPQIQIEDATSLTIVEAGAEADAKP